jgi:hypothetical protein
VGVFVTINATDFHGRRRENIVRARALWVDADSVDQLNRRRDIIRDTGAIPALVVNSSHDRAHFYWCCDDLSIDGFSECQAALIERLGTDPTIKDPSRVMRLPGTLHLKDPNRPRLVTLDFPNHPPVRWKVDDLKAKLGLSIKPTGGAKVRKPNSSFPPADAERLRRLFGSQYLTADYLGAGLATNLEEIESAVSAIPAMAISTELDWMKFAGVWHTKLDSSKAKRRSCFGSWRRLRLLLQAMTRMTTGSAG